jgi:chaperone required for assembly of F1-ATPase
MKQAPDPITRLNRFWKQAAVGPYGDGGWPVVLDGRLARTPAHHPLILPTEALATMVAAEWEAQKDYVVFAAMPATRLAFTAIDRVGPAREALAEEVAKYAGSDLLCYFADTPEALRQREEAAWGPLLDWAEQELGLRFVRASGIVHQAQPEQTVARARELALGLDHWRLAAVSWAAALYGSAVLALAVERGRLDGEAAFELSRLDEAFQEEQWGVDAEAAERTAKLREEAGMIGRWLGALG